MSDNKGRVSSKRSLGEKYSDLDKKFKILTVFGIIFCIAGLPLIIWGGIWAYNTYAIGGETPEDTPTTRLYSTFELISNVDGEIVSPFVEMDIWGQKDSADFSLGMEDITDLETNFERIETNADANDIEIDLTDVKMNGRILDIGGGGEGVIGQFKGDQVVAIDPSKRELEEAPKNKALNIVMDAKDLKFLDDTFDSVSIFFTMLYIPLNDHKKIFKEIYRVLKPNGELFLWDLIIPERKMVEKEIYVILLKIKIDQKIVDSGYGTKWEKEQDAYSFLKLGKDVGFEVLEQKIGEDMFFIKYKKI